MNLQVLPAGRRPWILRRALPGIGSSGSDPAKAPVNMNHLERMRDATVLLTHDSMASTKHPRPSNPHAQNPHTSLNPELPKPLTLNPKPKNL